MLDEYEKIVGHGAPGVITGKPLSIGGSKARCYSTAQGGFYVLSEAVKKVMIKGVRVAIQGFGNAGSNMAEILSKNGYKIVAVSDSKGAIYNLKGLNLPELLKHKGQSGTVMNFQGGKNLDEDILAQDVDVLILAALENAVTKENVELIKAPLVLELANGPIIPEADEILSAKSIVVIPDILTNAGGVAVSYFEQVQNAYNYYWTEEDVLKQLKELMVSSFNEVWSRKEQYKCDTRMGAYILAVERVAQAMRDRGWN